MIFVTVGMEKYPFDRLIRAVDDIAGKGLIKEKLVFQIGSSTYIPKHGEWKRIISFDEMKHNLENCRIVIGHAGAATILLSRLFGKTPVVMPRLQSNGEHLDNHQVDLVQRVAKENWIVQALEPEDLEHLFLTEGLGIGGGQFEPSGELARYLNEQFDSPGAGFKP